jgi:hypothetical protein
MPNADLANLGNHPNAWFSASVSYHLKHAGGGTTEIEQKPTAVSPEKMEE